MGNGMALCLAVFKKLGGFLQNLVTLQDNFFDLLSVEHNRASPVDNDFFCAEATPFSLVVIFLTFIDSSNWPVHLALSLQPTELITPLQFASIFCPFIHAKDAGSQVPSARTKE